MTNQAIAAALLALAAYAAKKTREETPKRSVCKATAEHETGSGGIARVEALTADFRADN